MVLRTWKYTVFSLAPITDQSRRRVKETNRTIWEGVRLFGGCGLKRACYFKLNGQSTGFLQDYASFVSHCASNANFLL